MEYDIISADTIADLIRAVRAKIGAGWEPLGGPRAVLTEWQHEGSIEYRPNGCVFFQAITRAL
jgi:hypothetical protein